MTVYIAVSIFKYRIDSSLNRYSREVSAKELFDRNGFKLFKVLENGSFLASEQAVVDPEASKLPAAFHTRFRPQLTGTEVKVLFNPFVEDCAKHRTIGAQQGRRPTDIVNPRICLPNPSLRSPNEHDQQYQAPNEGLFLFLKQWLGVVERGCR